MRLMTTPRKKIAAIDARISAVLTLERLLGSAMESVLVAGTWLT
jgi:hypothetical protein